MRDLFLSLSQLENNLIEAYGVTLNEAMLLCAIGDESVSAKTIIERIGLTPSHTSKVIKAVEEKGLIKRALGEKDKREMYFTLTRNAKNSLARIKQEGVDVPDLLLPLLNDYQPDEKE